MLTLYITPVVYLYMEALQQRLSRKKAGQVSPFAKGDDATPVVSVKG